MTGGVGAAAAIADGPGQGLAVAIDVSSLRDGGDAGAFVAFALSSLRGAEGVEPVAYGVRRARDAALEGVRAVRGTRARLGDLAARVGLPVTTRWSAPRADVRFLASGPREVRVTAPAVVSVLRVGAPNGPSRRRLEALRRAAGDGVVLHATTGAMADALAEACGVDRRAVVVVHPGVRVAAPAPADDGVGAPVAVLEGASATRDRAVLDALRAAGLAAVLVTARDAPIASSCCVLASPDEAFPSVAIEELAAGSPLVAARTPTTSELLEGAASLVDAAATQDFVDAAIALRGDARTVAVAAGRARAADYSWARRADDLVDVVRRALAA